MTAQCAKKMTRWEDRLQFHIRTQKGSRGTCKGSNDKYSDIDYFFVSEDYAREITEARVDEDGLFAPRKPVHIKIKENVIEKAIARPQKYPNLPVITVSNCIQKNGEYPCIKWETNQQGDKVPRRYGPKETLEGGEKEQRKGFYCRQ